MSRLTQIGTLFASIMGVIMPTTVHAGTIHVCWDGSGDYITIQDGIDAAFDGDEVIVCDGTYIGTGNRDLDFSGRLITLRSANGPRRQTASRHRP